MKKQKKEEVEVKGIPKSGRFWKTQKDRTSTMVKSRKKVGAKKLQALKEEKERVKELSQSIRGARKAAFDERRKREEENKKKKEENAKKSEVVQVIKNTAKLKRMKKKQLRKVEKRDTTKIEKKGTRATRSQKMDTAVTPTTS